MISSICLGFITTFHFLANQSIQVEKCFQFLKTFFLSAKLLRVLNILPTPVSLTEDYVAVYRIKLIVSPGSASGKVDVK